MNADEIKTYCINLSGTVETNPFGYEPVCYKLEGKIFAQIYLKTEKITLKCTPDQRDFLKSFYPGIVVDGYHCPKVQRPYWITVYYKNMRDCDLMDFIDNAYQAVISKLPKKIRKEYESKVE